MCEKARLRPIPAARVAMRDRCENLNCTGRNLALDSRPCFVYDVRLVNGEPTGILKSERLEARLLCAPCHARIARGELLSVRERDLQMVLAGKRPSKRSANPKSRHAAKPTSPISKRTTEAPKNPTQKRSPPKNGGGIRKKHGTPTPAAPTRAPAPGLSDRKQYGTPVPTHGYRRDGRIRFGGLDFLYE